MKQKRTFVTLLLVIALLCLGIAYAAISAQKLTINGSASATLSDDNFLVRFAKSAESYVEPTKTGTASAKVTEAKVTNDTTASFKIEGLTTEGETATITYTIENASPADIDADVDVVLDYDNTTWFTASVDKQTINLEQNGTATVAVTVTLKDTPATDAEASAATDTFTVTLTANAK
jgi:copper chaperone CopZ